ncbi:Nuclear transcription factor Y subunit A-1, variant 2 [Ancistrocladus abbreviatus]
MRSKSSVVNQAEPKFHAVPPSTVCHEQWWRGAGYDPLASTELGGSGTDSSSSNGIRGYKDNQSPSSVGLNMQEDDASRDSQYTAVVQPDGNSGQDPQKLPHGSSTTLFGNGECLVQPPQLELVGHSIACASSPYPDLYYGGMMATLGPQPLVHPHFYGMHQPRMPLPLDMAQEPVYVNAKQYHGILRRRQSRAKAELEKKLIKVRKPYLHESRHQHALRRARGSGGRFAKKSDADDSNLTAQDRGNCSDGGSQVTDTNATHANSNGSLEYKGEGDFKASSYHPRSSDSRGEGDHSNQQWG